jgi:hypothetical protein
MLRRRSRRERQRRRLTGGLFLTTYSMVLELAKE